MTLKQILKSVDTHRVFFFRQISDKRVELLIDREGWCGDYTINYARKVCRDLGWDFKAVFKSY